MERRQRNVFMILIWLVVLGSAPYTTLLIVEFDPALQPDTLISRLHLVPAGAIVINALLFLMALFVSRLCADMDVLQEEARQPQTTASESAPANATPSSSNAILKVLRLSRRSPLRGRVSEQALLYSVNDVTPTTADEANQALVKGVNEVEWIDGKGEVRQTRFTTQGHDLQAQFEQVKPPSQPEA